MIESPPSLHHGRARLQNLLAPLAAGVLAFASPWIADAATIQAGNVTTTLGPTFFVDDASNGGTDTDLHQPAVGVYTRAFNGLLTRNQGPTRVVLTGFGFAAHTSATANDATTVSVSFIYLGADEAVGGGDDVTVGTASGTFAFSVGGEYVFPFDDPLTANLTITGTRFRILVTPLNDTGNGSLKLKTGALQYEGTNGPKLSVAGIASPLIQPQRVNLAKFQAATASNFVGQRLPSYINDGVVGNDNRWQGEAWAWNWARIDLPFPVEVGSAHVFTGVDDTQPIGSYSIQYLSGGNWVTIPGGAVSGNTSVERNLVFTSPITASSFRFISGESSLRLRELALFPPNGPTGFPIGTDVNLNLAYERPAVASASTATDFALNAVDGRTTTFLWQTTTPGTNTLDIDLRVTSKVGSVHLYSGSTGVAPLADFTLKYWSAGAWVNVPGGTVTGNAAADLVVPFATPVTTSQIRLEFTNPGTTSVRELCVFPANTGNVGYPLGTGIVTSGRFASFEEFNDSFHRIAQPGSGRFIAVAGGSQPVLDPEGISTAQGQYQILLNVSNGTYRLRNRATGNCLSGAQLSKNPGDPLTDAPYVAMPHQDWILQPLGSGGYQLVNVWSGLAIDTQAGATARGTQLVQNTPSAAPTQRWQFTGRVGAPKKGIGGTSFANLFNPTWAYNWGQRTNDPLAPGIVHYPMQWGDFNWTIGSNAGPLWQYYSTWRDSPDAVYLLAFNEPDKTDQSNMTLASVVSLWPRLQELDLPLVSPAPANPDWLPGFFSEVNRLGYRVDYTAIHLYPGPSGGSSDGLFSSISGAFSSGAGRPVWLTEFSFVDWGRNQSWSEEDSYNTLAEFLWRAESVSQLRKYALFVFTEDADNPQPANVWQSVTPAPRSNSRDKHGTLTPFGKLYAGWDGDATVRTDRTYYVHNQATRKRLANALAAGPGARSIRIDDDSVRWTLVSAGAENRYHIVSARDGRRLGFDNATNTLSFVASGATGAATEWSLAEQQYGWFYINHLSSSKRLRLAYNNSNFTATFTLVASTNTDPESRWRFIAPPPETGNTAPVVAAIAPQTSIAGATIAFTATATDSSQPVFPLYYSLVNAPTGATIHATTGAFSWTPSPAQIPGTYSFTLRVSDGLLTQDQTVTVTTLAALPSATNDTDGDGMSDLLEYAYGTSQTVPNASPFRILSATPGGSATIEFTWNWQATGFSWRLLHGRDLASAASWPVVPPGTTTVVREGAVDRITVTPAMDHPDRGFFILDVVTP